MGWPEVDWAAQNWADLIPRLHLMAIWRLRQLRHPGVAWAEAGDFVNDAITKTIAGVRIWIPDNCTLYQHLAGVIASDISHAATSSESRLTVPDYGRTNGSTTWPPDIADDAPNQEEIELGNSDRRRLLEYLNRIDPKMGSMAELLLVHDVKETADLSRFLQLNPSEVANLRKRMKRAARAYCAENQS